MDRRASFGTICATIAAGGIASVIGATALQAGSPYFNTLIYAGIAAIAAGFVGLVCLFIFPEKANPVAAPAFTRVDQSVTSHNQTGGQTAHTILNREPDPVPERRLTPEQIAALREVLEGSSVKGSILEVQFASNEHARFSAQIASIFERAGWKRNTFCIPSREKPHAMKVGWMNNQTAAYRLAVEALRAAGLEFTEGEYEGPPADISLDAGILKMTAFQRAADKWPE